MICTFDGGKFTASTEYISDEWWRTVVVEMMSARGTAGYWLNITSRNRTSADAAGSRMVQNKTNMSIELNGCIPVLYVLV